MTFYARDSRFLRSHLWVPLCALAAAFCVVEVLGLDPIIARAWSFDAHTGQWLGAGAGSWWARDVLHDGGRWLVRAAAAAAILAWALSFALPRARAWRRPAAFVALAIVLATAIVGGLKAVTNVDCPWDLEGFGGHNPYIPLFADRPDDLPRAKCFPGAHSSSGFALMCFYFVLSGRHPRLARAALASGIGVGIVFSIGQEARGAHFLSHDLTSAALVWFIQLALYCWMLRRACSPAEAAVVRAEPGACSSTTHPPAAT